MYYKGLSKGTERDDELQLTAMLTVEIDDSGTAVVCRAAQRRVTLTLAPLPLPLTPEEMWPYFLGVLPGAALFRRCPRAILVPLTPGLRIG